MKAEELSLEMFKGYTYLFIEGYLVQEHDMILRAIELAKEAGLQVCLDMASYNIVAGDMSFSPFWSINMWILFLPMRKRLRRSQAKNPKKRWILLPKCVVLPL